MNRLVGGRYDIGDEIGRGGMATVHAAYDTRLGRAVAVKMLHAGRLGDRTFQGRFRREAHAAASLSHPNIVAVFDSGEDIVENAVGVTEVVPYIVMELVEGHTLSQLMHDQGPSRPRTPCASASRSSRASATPTSVGSSTGTSSPAT